MGRWRSAAKKKEVPAKKGALSSLSVAGEGRKAGGREEGRKALLRKGERERESERGVEGHSRVGNANIVAVAAAALAAASAPSG